MDRKPPTITNPFQVLEEEGEDKLKELEGQTSAQEAEMKGSEEDNNIGNMQVIMEEDEVEDMEIGDLDLDALNHLYYETRTRHSSRFSLS